MLEDVQAQEAVDDRAIYLQLEEKRYELASDTSLPKVTSRELKLWWEKSAKLALHRDPDTGALLEGALTGSFVLGCGSFYNL